MELREVRFIKIIYYPDLEDEIIRAFGDIDPQVCQNCIENSSVELQEILICFPYVTDISIINKNILEIKLPILLLNTLTIIQFKRHFCILFPIFQ